MVGNLNTWRSHWCWCHSLKIDWEPCIRDLKCATSLQLGQGSRISVWFLDLNIRICDSERSDTVQEWRKKYRSKNLRNTCHLKCIKLKLQTGGAPSCKLAAHFKTLCKYECMILSHDGSKILTACRMLQISIAHRQMKPKIHSFPTMYILWGGRCGRNGSNQGFRPRIMAKTRVFGGHKYGLYHFRVAWDAKF